jgi:hypothetical protein
MMDVVVFIPVLDRPAGLFAGPPAPYGAGYAAEDGPHGSSRRPDAGARGGSADGAEAFTDLLFGAFGSILALSLDDVAIACHDWISRLALG